MLTLILGKDWTANRSAILEAIAEDVRNCRGNRILVVPELISHETERLLCDCAGSSTSRFAEVLSFSRLCKRVADSVGHGAPECLDEGGRLVAMAAAVNQVQSRIKYYAAVGTKPEFLTGMLDGIDEFKRCCIQSADLMAASRQAEGSFAQKLEELALLLESYDSICSHSKLDPRDQMMWLLEELENSDYAAERVFYVDGFPDFTRQHMAILEHLIINSPSVTVSLNCDVPNSGLLAFEKAGETAGELIRAAKRANIPVQIQTVDGTERPTMAIAQALFQGKLPDLPAGTLLVQQYDSIHAECNAVAEQILELVQKGCRFRDISIVCGDMNVYRNMLRKVLGRCNIPIYLSGNDEVLEKPVIKMVLCAIDGAVGGFEQGDILRYARSMFSPLDEQECDLVENYVFLWGISGNGWLQDWQKHPDGLEGKQTEMAQMHLSKLNELRRRLIDPLVNLRNSFRDAATVAQQTAGLYAFMEQINLAQRLSQFADRLEDQGDNRSAQILDQLWDILISAMEQMHDAMGHTAWDQDAFARLFRLLISQYTVGTIPAVLDSVMVGSVAAMRCQQVKHLFVVGATEGAFPAYGSSTGILTDPERISLREMGVPLTGGAADGLQVSFSEIYGVFGGAQESVVVSCPSGQPSYVFRRLQDAAEDEAPAVSGLGGALINRMEAAAYLSRNGAVQASRQLLLEKEFENIREKICYNQAGISEENIRGLYGTKLKLSASQIDKQAECRMAYFLKYGLRAKERKEATVDPAEFGTYVHAVLEKTARKIVDMGGFHLVGKDDALQIAAEYSAEYIADRFGDLDSDRVAYLLNRNAEEINLIVAELWEELHECEFSPVLFEMRFGGKDGDVPAIEIQGGKMDAIVRGVVDRVDIWKKEDRNFLRVVDYKTGKKDFDYCDVFNGLGLQMLLYLFALRRGQAPGVGANSLPAGIQYFPARIPLVTADGILDDESAADEREKLFKRKGLLLRDEAVLTAMDPHENPKRLAVRRKKDGSLSGDLADLEQFSLLESYIYRLLSQMVDQIASGNVEANPYTRGSRHNACWYCPYGAVCHADEVQLRRNYEQMSAERFWDEIRKEMTDRG